MVNGTVRSAFEYGGQKCSACSRMYVPDSLWPQIRQQLLDTCRDLKVGDVSAGMVPLNDLLLGHPSLTDILLLCSPWRTSGPSSQPSSMIR